ncbi:MAG TPA: hypothetical protein VGK73_06905, partial [Polyangiaceae bacterium]
MPGIILTTPETLPPGQLLEEGVPVPLDTIPVPPGGWTIKRIPEADEPFGPGYPILIDKRSGKRIGRIIPNHFTRGLFRGFQPRSIGSDLSARGARTQLERRLQARSNPLVKAARTLAELRARRRVPTEVLAAGPAFGGILREVIKRIPKIVPRRRRVPVPRRTPRRPAPTRRRPGDPSTRPRPGIPTPIPLPREIPEGPPIVPPLFPVPNFPPRPKPVAPKTVPLPKRPPLEVPPKTVPRFPLPGGPSFPGPLPAPQ